MEHKSGYSEVWLSRMTGGHEIAGSNPVTPIYFYNKCQDEEEYGWKLDFRKLLGDAKQQRARLELTSEQLPEIAEVSRRRRMPAVRWDRI